MQRYCCSACRGYECACSVRWPCGTDQLDGFGATGYPVLALRQQSRRRRWAVYPHYCGVSAARAGIALRLLPADGQRPRLPSHAPIQSKLNFTRPVIVLSVFVDVPRSLIILFSNNCERISTLSYKCLNLCGTNLNNKKHLVIYFCFILLIFPFFVLLLLLQLVFII